MYNYNIKIGERLRAYRLKKGWTLAQLAKRIGVTLQTIGKYERGVSSPDINVVIELCFALDITPNELCGISRPADLTTVEDLSKAAEILDRLIKKYK